MIQTKNVTVNSNEYMITSFDAITGNIILFKLIKYLRGGTSLFDGLSTALSGVDSIMNADLSKLSIGTALDNILANIDPDEINTFFVMMLKNTSFKEENGQFTPLTSNFIKGHFAENYLEMYALIIEIIKANYMNDGTLSFFAQTRKKLKPLASQKTTKNTQKN